MNTQELTHLLKQRYEKHPGQYVTLHEVANGKGFSKARRYCDLIALSMWNSDGLEWIGHEVKVSRSDWLNEIKDPDKADAFANYCDRFWFVAADKSIIKKEELRPGFGLMYHVNGKLRVSVGAPKREPMDPSKGLVASIIYRASQNQTLDVEKEALKNEIARLKTEIYNQQRRGDRCNELEKSVKDFEESSGIKINSYNGSFIGREFKAFQNLPKDHNILQRFRTLKSEVDHLSATVNNGIVNMQEILGHNNGKS